MTDREPCAYCHNRPATRHGYCDACGKRWIRAGRPESGPPPPMSRADTGRKRWEAARERAAAEVEVQWGTTDKVITRWAAVDPRLRRTRALPAAAALAERVRLGDRQGVEILLSKFTDWGALLVVLAECADPERVAVVCTPRQRKETRAA